MNSGDYVDQFLEANEVLFKKGDQWSLMQSIWICAKERRPLPDWVANEFIAAYEKVRMAEVKSWDDAFGRPHEKGRSLAAIRKKRKHLGNVARRIREIQHSEPSTPIDGRLFERVGKEFAIGKTLASDYYYEAIKIFGDLIPD